LADLLFQERSIYLGKATELAEMSRMINRAKIKNFKI